jgi:hypothetical protein
LFFLSQIYINALQGGFKAGVVSIVLTLVNSLLVPLIGAFFYALLQALSEGIYLVMDIEEHLRK